MSQLLLKLNKYLNDETIQDIKISSIKQERSIATAHSYRLFSKIFIILNLIALFLYLFGKFVATGGKSNPNEYLAAMDNAADASALLNLIVFFLITFLILKFFKKKYDISNILAKRLNAVGALKSLENDERKPIVYLRPFALDKTELPSFLTRSIYSLQDPPLTEEGEATLLFAKKGPVIAIGKPGELLPVLGASRFYIDDLVWKEVANILFSEAQIILFRPGGLEDTSGLNWEIEQCLEEENLKKLHFIFFNNEFEYFKKIYVRLFHFSVPEKQPKGANVLYFKYKNELRWL